MNNSKSNRGYNAFHQIYQSDEFLHSCDVPGLPPHNLQFKAGSVVLMLRNLNQRKLWNGSRLAITKLISNVIHAGVLEEQFKGEE